MATKEKLEKCFTVTYHGRLQWEKKKMNVPLVHTHLKQKGRGRNDMASENVLFVLKVLCALFSFAFVDVGLERKDALLCMGLRLILFLIHCQKKKKKNFFKKKRKKKKKRWVFYNHFFFFDNLVVLV